MSDRVYDLLTATICWLGRLRRRFVKARRLRFDRTLPWVTGQPADGLWMVCCDCQLAHFFAMGHSGTPERPANYDYRWRGKSVEWTAPDPHLGEAAKSRWMDFRRGIIAYYEKQGEVVTTALNESGR